MLTRQRSLVILPPSCVVMFREPMSASLVDYGLFLFWNAAELLSRGSGPYFYLPKMESHKSAQRLTPHMTALPDALQATDRGVPADACCVQRGSSVE